VVELVCLEEDERRSKRVNDFDLIFIPLDFCFCEVVLGTGRAEVEGFTMSGSITRIKCGRSFAVSRGVVRALAKTVKCKI
jgi:hypothetical protein